MDDALDSENHGSNQNGKHEEDDHVSTGRDILARTDDWLPASRVAVKHANDPVDATLDASGKIAVLEVWDDRAGNNDRRNRVGEGAFKAVADLDTHLVLGRRDEKQYAIVLLRLAEFPGAE
jgi:hypothetical protein